MHGKSCLSFCLAGTSTSNLFYANERPGNDVWWLICNETKRKTGSKMNSCRRAAEIVLFRNLRPGRWTAASVTTRQWKRMYITHYKNRFPDGERVYVTAWACPQAHRRKHTVYRVEAEYSDHWCPLTKCTAIVAVDDENEWHAGHGFSWKQQPS